MHTTAVRSGLLQRRCACGGTPGRSGECAECRRRRLARVTGTRARLAVRAGCDDCLDPTPSRSR
jgi:hypothetical protein